MQNFFSDHIEDGIVYLDEHESSHAIRVMRLKEGSRIRVFDGKGGIYLARISNAHPLHLEAAVEEHLQQTSRASWRLHVAIAPTKQTERFEYFLEKATEAGIDEITPLLCERSERKKLRYDRLERVVTAALKQSMQPFLPHIHLLTSFREFISRSFPGDKLIAHCCDQEDPDRKHLYDSITTSQVTLLIGPEGDFSPQEVQEALQKGFRPVSLGDTRLRTETAGITAAIITAVKFRNLK